MRSQRSPSLRFTPRCLGFFITSVASALPAWMMLIYWVGLQVLSGFASIGQSPAAASPSGRTS